jgi:hypothetical protein
MATIQERMMRAAKLDVELYEEVEADPTSMGQATAVVVMASVAAGIGGGGGASGLIVGTLAALISWYIWAYMTYFIGTRLLPEPQTSADHGELLRTTGFSAAPGLIRILAVFGIMRELIFLVAGVWMLVAMVIAVRQALDYTSTGRAVGVCMVGWLVQIVVGVLMISMLG